MSDSLARDTSRRGFLARVGGALVALTAARTVGSLIEPGESEAFHFCGHTYTTGSCPHPTGLPRIDSRGFPLRAGDGHPVDDIGRPVNDAGQPVDGDGQLLRGPDGRPIPPAPRTQLCKRTGEIYGFHSQNDGSWYRCCGGKVRQLRDCCAHHNTRINGDAALAGYCFGGRKVYCVQYYDTKVPC
ncbi:MAG TPA: hypothetical protein VH501_10125 [Solirubrobacterales bacterium]|jgi:hypothetical protein